MITADVSNPVERIGEWYIPWDGRRKLKGCNGCKFDPTYEELKQGITCNTKGCRNESKYKKKDTVQGKVNKWRV